jgi:CRP/FNR family cyclic AMP-dependent transcriptional regulator
VPIHFSTLAAVPLLEGLHADDLNALAPNIESRTYGKGEALFLKGDPGGALLIVVSGVVELFIYDDDQNRIVLNQVGAGGFFGEVTLFDSGKRTANAIATETTEILVLRQNVMVSFLQRHPDAAIHVINVLSQRLRDNTALLTTNKNRMAYDVLKEKRQNIWDRVADTASTTVGSWRYLSVLIGLIVVWIILNVSNLLGVWDRPFEFNVLNLLLTVVGALQVPLILMAQRRQDDYARIAADLEYQVNLKAQLSILEVTRKLDWLREAMLDQTARLERLEANHDLSEVEEAHGNSSTNTAH